MLVSIDVSVGLFSVFVVPLIRITFYQSLFQYGRNVVLCVFYAFVEYIIKLHPFLTKFIYIYIYIYIYI